MRVVVQKCLESSVSVDGKVVSKIGKGFIKYSIPGCVFCSWAGAKILYIVLLTPTLLS